MYSCAHSGRPRESVWSQSASRNLSGWTCGPVPHYFKNLVLFLQAYFHLNDPHTKPALYINTVHHYSIPKTYTSIYDSVKIPIITPQTYWTRCTFYSLRSGINDKGHIESTKYCSIGWAENSFFSWSNLHYAWNLRNDIRISHTNFFLKSDNINHCRPSPKV